MSIKTTSDNTLAKDYCGTFYAAKLLRLSVGTIQSLVEKNELQAWKTKGGHRRISMQSIRELQEKRGLTDIIEKHTQLRVLLVEDDATLLDVMRSTIDKWNLPIDCTTMTSAVEAMLDMASIRPDVLLTDVNMPGVDGLELIRRITANPMFSDMIILAVTGLSPEQIRDRGGVPKHVMLVQKPLDFKWLQGFFAALSLMRQKETSEEEH
jgi:excisionase family DNA binding protein